MTEREWLEGLLPDAQEEHMTDADTVRSALIGIFHHVPHPALAALDRLIAERDEAQEALRYFTHGEKTITVGREWIAELVAERDRLREALGGLATAVENYRDFEPEWNVGEPEWSAESTAAWNRIEEVLDANRAAAREALGSVVGGHQ